jgi:transposase
MTLPDAAKTAVKALAAILAAILEDIEKAIGDREGQIADAHARSDMNRLLARVPGVGKLIASVITASTPDPSVSGQGATSPPGSGSRRGKTQVAASRRSAASASRETATSENCLFSP